MPAGQLQYVTANPSQILNPIKPNAGPTLIENLLYDPNSPVMPGPINKFSIDLSWQAFQTIPPVFDVPPNPLPPPIPLPGGNLNIYTLPPGASYAWPADQPLFARISPALNPDGETVPIWVQPEGIGQSSRYTSSTVNPIPLPAVIDPTSIGATPVNPLYVQTAPLAVFDFVPTNPDVGKSAGYILPEAGFIKMITGNLVCGAGINQRMLYLSILYAATGVLPFQFIIGTTDQSATFVGAMGIQNGTLGSILNFSLPVIMLPAGSKISINVVGQNPDDYLDDLDLILSPAA